MNSIVGDRYIAELHQIFQQQGSALYAGQHSLCLTAPCLHYIQRKLFTLHESTGNPLPGQYAHLQGLEESFSRILILKLISDKNYQLSPSVTLSLKPFKSVHSLILKKVSVSMITGLSKLRSQLRLLVVQRCGVQTMEDIIVRCGADDSGSFSWASLKEADFSHNSFCQLGDSLQFLTAIEKVDLSNNVISDESTGVELIDCVSYLHLGFNQLKKVPRFGPRAKFNLTGLNLRNNRLVSIEGVQELDSLTDLDLTDNLLTRHSDLQPLRNLHNLGLLSLIGNPLSFHPKHRVKSVECLSNLINPSSFRLDSKKLSSSEKKAIPRSLTHYPGTSPSNSSHTASASPCRVGSRTLTPPPPSSQMISGESPAHHSDACIITKRRRHKKPPAMRVVALHDSDEDQDSLNDTGSGILSGEVASSVPLQYQKRLQKMKELAKQMPDKWLLSNASLDTTSSESNQMARGASQPRPAQESPPLGPVVMETVDKATTGDGGLQRRSKRSNGRSNGNKRKKNGRADAVAVDEPRTSTPIITSEIDGASGECFLVERYESDVEEMEEGESDQILLAISDRFLEEKDINGKVLDRMDLGCLMTVEVRVKPWKLNQQVEVVTLKFNHERRDRRKREYVMIELNYDTIIDILGPISEENQKAFSLTCRVECFTCQRVFDATESMLMPQLKDTAQLSPPPHHGPGYHQRPSLSNRYCPFCKSQQLQYVTNTPEFKQSLSHPSLPKQSISKTAVESGGGRGDEKGSVTLGFTTMSDDTGGGRGTKGRQQCAAFVGGGGGSEKGQGEWEDLEKAHSYNAIPPSPSRHGDATTTNSESISEQTRDLEKDQQYTISSWSYSEFSENPPQQQNYLRTSHDVLYHSRDQVGVETQRKDDLDQADSSSIGSHDTQFSRRDIRGSKTLPHNGQKHLHRSDDENLVTEMTSKSDFSQSGEKSGRLTNSEPLPKIQPFPEETEDTKRGEPHPGLGLRSSSHDQPQCSHGNQFDNQPSLYCRSSTDPMATPRMRIPRASLSSLQEQPPSTAMSLNPFDNEPESSTNPFDIDNSTNSNPFGPDDDEQEEEEEEEEESRGENAFSQTRQTVASSFTRNEERYFKHLKSDLKESRGLDKDFSDYDSPSTTRYPPPPSSSVPATSFMTGLPSHRSSFSDSPHHRQFSPNPRKNATLPYSQSPKETQENPELQSKRSPATIPRGKPPIPGGLVRGKSMESLDRCSPKNESHPMKSNRIISPRSKRRWKDPYGEGQGGEGQGVSGGRGEQGKEKRKASMSPSAGNGSSGSSTPHSTRRGHSSSDTQSPGRGGRKRMTRVTSVGDIQYAPDHYSSREKIWGGGGGAGNGGQGEGGGGERHGSAGSVERGRRISSADESRASSRSSSHRESGGGSSSGGGGGGSHGRTRGKLSMSGGSSDGHRKIQKLSSSESSGRPLSTSVLIKEEDPGYIHNSINLHLDLEVFSKDKGEHFKMVFKAPMVKYKSKKEVPVVAIFSNLNSYIYRITAPQSSQMDKWLSLQQTLPLSKLVYLDVGPFHQFLRLEFSIPESCFTFLLRDKMRCRESLTRISMIVSDAPKSTFKSVGICPFRMETISHPERALREAIMFHYNKTKSTTSQRTRRSPNAREDDESVKLYMLAHRHIHIPGKKHSSKIPVTVVVAEDEVYIAQESFHHWPLPRLQQLPAKEALDPPFTSIERREISDIEKIIMDPDQTCRLILGFFKETLSDGDSKYWSIIAENESHVQLLIEAIQTPWENMFKVPLTINYK